MKDTKAISGLTARDQVRPKVFGQISRTTLESTLENVSALIRPPHNVFYKELEARHGAVRRWLPEVLQHLVFDASPAGRPVVEAYEWLRDNHHAAQSAQDAPKGMIGEPGSVMFCAKTAVSIFELTRSACWIG